MTDLINLVITMLTDQQDTIHIQFVGSVSQCLRDGGIYGKPKLFTASLAEIIVLYLIDIG